MDEVIAISPLLDFLTSESDLGAQLRKVLVEKSFAQFHITHIFLGVLDDESHVRYPLEFFDNFLLSQRPQRDEVHKLDSNTPGYGAYVNNELVECGDFDSYPFYDREATHDLFPQGFEYSMIFPIPSVGAVYLFGSIAVELESHDRNQLRDLGKVLSLVFKENEIINAARLVTNELIRREPGVPLTSRQWAIREAMLRGLTNAAIAKEMNFSESLIRHETIRIYSKMGITGRKELFSLEMHEHQYAEESVGAV